MSATYEPKHFRPLIPTDPSNPSAHYNEIPLECACGGIDTQHHQMTLKVKTACDDGIHAVQQPHPHASHHGDIHNDQQGQHEPAAGSMPDRRDTERPAHTTPTWVVIGCVCACVVQVVCREVLSKRRRPMTNSTNSSSRSVSRHVAKTIT